MAVDEGLRKLAAILAADVAGYSRLMADDERATVRTLTAYREIFSANVGAHQGRIVYTAGDSVLATFDSVVEAVEAAVEVQRALGLRNEELPGHRQMHFRIGVNLGDIIHRDDGTIYGDGVNIAARLESLAEPGGVMVADIAAQAIEGKLGVDLADAGAHEVKNIAKPVRAWRVVVEGEVLGAAGPPDAKTLRRPKLVAGLVAGLAILVGLAVWGLTIRIEVPQMVKADGTPTDDPVLAMPIGPSIAVLPFENLSDGEERSYFADGLTEELITALSRFQDLKVIARHSTLRYKDQAVDVRAVAEELGVGYIVVGSVRRSTDAVRITVQLLEGQDGSHLWSETYDRALTAANLIAIQDELASQIVDRVAGAYGEIARRMAAAARKKSPASLDSYDCILRAYAFLEVLTPEEHLRVRDCLEAVIAEDPDNVEALAWLASRYAEEFALGFNPEPESLERALTMARRAARLDPSNQWARHIYAWVLFFTGDFTEFRAEAERAIQLNPNNALTLGDLGLQIAYSGEWERGLALVQKAIALNPFHPGWYLFPFYFERYYANDYATALDYAKAVNMSGFWGYHSIVAAAHGQLGDIGAGRKEIEALLALRPGYTTELVKEDWTIWGMTAVQTEHLAEGLRKAGLPDALPKPSRPVIAVLPFANMSGDPEQAYFADGITEDIITRLAQYPDILVLGRNTTFQFKDQAVDIKTIAEKLGADYIVEGSIRRGGDTVRVTAQLLGAEDGTHHWAETFDRTLTPSNLFAVQDEITIAVANRIADKHGAISVAEADQVPWQTPDQLSSYECVLRFHEYERLWNPNTHLAVRDCLEAVNEREPDYGVAFSYLAHVSNAEIFGPMNPRPDSSLRKGLNLAEEGVRLDPTNGHTHVFLAYSLLLNDDPDNAVREADEALRLSPNSAVVIGNAALVHLNTGGYDRTEELMDKLTVLNPNYPLWMNWNIAKVHFIRHEYPETITWLERAGSETWHWTHAYIAAALCAQGEIERGKASIERALQIMPNLAEVYWPETHMWFKGDGVYPLMDIVGSGLTACGWKVPPDPVRETAVEKSQ